MSGGIFGSLKNEKAPNTHIQCTGNGNTFEIAADERKKNRQAVAIGRTEFTLKSNG